MHQALAVLGIALIAMGEEIGSEMAIRTLNHLVRPAGTVTCSHVPWARRKRPRAARLTDAVPFPPPLRRRAAGRIRQMHYGELVIRRAVPLALGLLCVCDPQAVAVLDTLSKYSHDNDAEVSQAAIFALGLVGAGTNNARVAQMLRQLAQYYQTDANNLFIVRLAQVRRERRRCLCGTSPPKRPGVATGSALLGGAGVPRRASCTWPRAR